MYTVRIFYTDGERETINCKSVSYEDVALLESEDERTIIVPYYNVYKIEVEE